MYRIVLIPLLLLILAVALIPLLADKAAILDIATSALYKETGATLTVAGDTELTLFPTLGISLSDVAVVLDGQDHRDLRARSVKMGVQLLPLLKGNIAIDTVSLEGLIVRSEPHTEGVDNGTRGTDIAADGVSCPCSASFPQGEATADYRCSLGRNRFHWRGFYPTGAG